MTPPMAPQIPQRCAEGCGDWLLLPPGRVPTSGRTAALWTRVEADGGSSMELWTQPPSQRWVGAPWRRFEDDRVRGWLWGESMASEATLLAVARGADPALAGGRFVLIVHHLGGEDDGARFEVITDRLGSLHAYWVPLARGLVVGSSFDAVAAHVETPSLDWLGLAGFFAHGFFPQGRTHLARVEILAPASRHRLYSEGATPGEIHSQRYWQWRHTVDSARSYDDTVAEFGERFEAVIAESSRGRVAIPISGGLDSRAVVAAMDEVRDCWSFSYGYQPGSVETRIAQRLAQVRGLPFEAFVVDAYLADGLADALATVEGFQDVTQSRQLSVAEPLALHADTVIAAHWGDVWLDDMGWHGRHPTTADPRATVSQAAVVEHTLGRLRKRGGDWLLQHVCAAHLDAEPKSLLRDMVAEDLGALEHLDDPDFRIKAWKTDHWSFRWTLASVRAYQAAVLPRLPFYDPRLVDFFCTVPTDLVAGRRLEIDYIRRRSPALGRVPWQHTGTALGMSTRRAYWQKLPRRALAKLWRTVRRRPVIERNWQIQFAGSAGRQLLDSRLLATGLPIHELVEPPAIRALIDHVHARPDAANGYALSMLLTFAAWLQRQEAKGVVIGRPGR